MQLTTAALSAAVLALAVPMSADAAVVERVFSSQATNYCQSALPVFDGNIRKRPLAVVNEGTSPAFVTCSFAMQGNDSGHRVSIWVSALGASATLSCTGVMGYTGQSAAVTKSRTLTSSGQIDLSFFATDFPDAPATFQSGLLSVSCALPPNVALYDTYVFFREDVNN